MAKNLKPKKNNAPPKNNAAGRKGKAASAAVAEASSPWSRRLAQEMLAVLFLGLALFSLLALVSYSRHDPQGLLEAWKAATVRNWMGKAGALLAAGFLNGFGMAALWLPAVLSGLAWTSHRRGLETLSPWQFLAGFGVFAATAGLLTLAWPFIPWEGGHLNGGGLVGAIFCRSLLANLNPPGAALALGVILLLCLMGATRLSFVGFLALLGRTLQALGALVWRRREESAAPSPRPRRLTPERPLVTRPASAPPEVVVGPPSAPAPDPGAAMAPKPRRSAASGGFTLPPLDLLDQVPPWDQQVHEGMMVAQAEKLEDTLRHFGVEGKVVSITTGPVVSRFELEPAPGVKISKVTGLADDLALALKALSIRIVAPVPGKAVIGIEVPNAKRQVVGLREILSDAAYRKSSSRLTIALGKDIMGQPVVNDLGKMPHLLIAGATGSGKSVGLNAMILSILYKATPQEVRFLLIDPKRIELSTYEGIPHLLHPVVVNPKEATVALHWAVAEMERRYALLSDLAVRNIEGFNQKVKTAKERPREGGEPLRPLPYIVIVIDELADLMLVSSRDTEEYLIRLAQKARASGVHLLVATQRPSVDVITGLIKANFPTRVSYQVSAKMDSRVILDVVGAERLLGMGDLLFLPPGTSRLKRIHGAFVSDAEVTRVVEFLRTQQSPEFEIGILEMQEKDVEEGEKGEKDEKWDAAVELVAETRNASISMLQRRLRIGYNRAARIIETMENEGLIGPSDGLKPREVYVPRR
ncbi:MAG: DNA translocase FtsK [Desulfobaccales bacterium]